MIRRATTILGLPQPQTVLAPLTCGQTLRETALNERPSSAACAARCSPAKLRTTYNEHIDRRQRQDLSVLRERIPIFPDWASAGGSVVAPHFKAKVDASQVALSSV